MCRTRGSENFLSGDTPRGPRCARVIGPVADVDGIFIDLSLFFFVGNPFSVDFKGKPKENHHSGGSPRKTRFNLLKSWGFEGN